MAFTFLRTHLLSSTPILMLIGLVILLIVAPLRVIVSYLALFSFLGAARNKLLLPDLVLRLSIMHSLILQLNFCGYDGFWLTWVPLRQLVPLFIVIIRAPSRLLTMMFFMSEPNILRLIVTSFDTTFSRAHYIFDQFPSKINLPIFSQSLIHLVDYVILFPNSS